MVNLLNVYSKELLDKDYNPGQSIWHKVRKSSKIGQDLKRLLTGFACFLIAIVKV